MQVAAVSFDLGQTLVELDEQLLAEQARRSGYWLLASQVSNEQDRSWQAYNVAKAQGKTGYAAWSAFMSDLLPRLQFCTESRLPVSAEQIEAFVQYLWSEQPNNNLWRRPVPGMLELVRELAARGTKLGVLTNSEGRAKELVDAAGFGSFIQTVVDSGVEGIEKPDRTLFELLATRLNCDVGNVVHVGDSYEADVLGALGAGMTPIWFVRETTVTLPPGVLWCRNANELRKILLEEK